MSGRSLSPALGVRVLLAAAVLEAVPLAGQDLAQRVRQVEGEVAFRFRARPGVEVCEHGFRVDGGRATMGRWRDGWDDTCVEGGAEVVVSVRAGRLQRLELAPPGTRRSEVDLGEVPAAEAAEFLLSLAGTDDQRAARDALAPAAIADAETWPRLLEIGRNRTLDRELRQAALFWVSRAAAEVVSEGLSQVARDERDDEEVRKAAVFALSRRSAEEAVPALIDVARTASGREVRESALFWLARVDDPRVIPFFEEILRGERRGGA